jgi:hypothetical protein
MKLTQKESQLLTYISEGMDEPGCGWLHEIAPSNWTNRCTAGVLSSLIRKNLVTSIKHTDSGITCYWVERKTV